MHPDTLILIPDTCTVHRGVTLALSLHCIVALFLIEINESCIMTLDTFALET